ncbi:MAG TPA: hypothetical protein VN947_23805 [Polyangia bacterium]|nr:hypothetical protein [Polyangia bacterium]
MSDEDDKQGRDDEDTAPFARESELRREEESTPLAGCDVEHCRRMRD